MQVTRTNIYYGRFQKNGRWHEPYRTRENRLFDKNKRTFFYEADIRNEGSTKLLHKLENQFEILKQGLEETTTDSGKMLKLQGYVLKAK